MEQDTHKRKSRWLRRVAYLIFALTMLTVALSIVLALLSPELENIYRDIFPAPVATPAHSAQELWDNPLPTPEWITQIQSVYEIPSALHGKRATLSDLQNNRFCLAVNFYSIWDWETDKPGFQLYGITVDDMIISHRNMDFWHVSTAYENMGCDVKYPGEPFPQIAGITGGGIKIAPSHSNFLIAKWGSVLRSDSYDDDGCPKFIHAPNRICFYTPHPAPGLHTATIRIENNAGVPYTYEWAFRVR